MKPLQTLPVLFFCVFFCGALFISLSANARDRRDPNWLADASARTDASLLTIKNSLVNKDTTVPGDEPDTTEKIEPKRSYFQLGVSYITNSIYLGRKDSATIPYISPVFGYYHKSGFFANASVGYTAADDQSRIDMFSLAAGYSFTAGDYEGEFTASKYFYNSQSTNIKSEMNGSLDYFNAYDFGFIRPSASGSVSLGLTTDISGSFGLEHTFVVFGDKMDITPSLTANGSTQNFYNEYFSKRRYTIKRKGKRPVQGVASISGEVVDQSAFKILDYEIGLPVSYHAGKFTFALTPVYAIPVHPSQLIITTQFSQGGSNKKTVTEKLENSLFATFEIDYKF